MDSLDESPNIEPDGDGPQNPTLRFLWGLGISLDVWLIAILSLVWLFVLAANYSFGYAALMVFLVFGIPFVVILFSDIGAALTFYKYSMEEIDPLAIKIFAWVYMIGFQIYWIYLLSK